MVSTLSFASHLFFEPLRCNVFSQTIGKSQDFERTMTTLAEELKEESFGFELLQALGYIYEQKAKQFLGES